MNDTKNMTQNEIELLKSLNKMILLSIDISKKIFLGFSIMVFIFSIIVYFIIQLNTENSTVIILLLAASNAFSFYYLKSLLFKKLNKKNIEEEFKYSLINCNEYLLKSKREYLLNSPLYSKNINKNNAISFCIKNIDAIFLKHIIVKQIEKEEN
tara:strand:+ start:22008 stop:22469 length:462 start_codon:yes stop_codon:yes gene_type:complete